MIPKRRIYISAPADAHLSQDQLDIKRAILHAIENEGFEPQEFFNSGIPKMQAWSFKVANQVMSRSQGIAILAFYRWHCTPSYREDVSYDLPSEYNHVEGALAFSHKLPMLVITDRRIRTSGITLRSEGPVIYWPNDKSSEGINDEYFKKQFTEWCTQVKSRPHVFLGYCSNARNTAIDIAYFMQRELGLIVGEYSMDFQAGGTILDQIEVKCRESTCGVFLFTKDDQFTGDDFHAAPRDNVIFEAGYFMHAKGKEQVLIICEEGAKMPADIGGNIYIPLKDRNDISGIHTQLRHFLENRL
jgi:hypothetical protein